MNDIMKSKPRIKGSTYGLAAAWLFVSLLGLVGAMPVCAQNLSITESIIAGGGGTSTNGGFSVTGTLGLPGAGAKLSGGSFQVEGGFWQAITLVQTPQTPLLFLTRTGNQASIHWDAASTGFILEWTASLKPPVNWQPVTGVANNQWDVQPMAGVRFFRLRQSP